MVYVLDTNSLRILQNYYPDRFPSFWTKFDDLVLDGQVVSPREVSKELELQFRKEWFRDWVSRNKSLFVVPGPDETQMVAQILAIPHFQTIVGRKQILKGSPVADPWIVACAYVREGTVVTEEVNTPNAARIPNVCEHFGVPFMNLESFMDELGWTF
jgi:hypothetical protein